MFGVNTGRVLVRKKWSPWRNGGRREGRSGARKEQNGRNAKQRRERRNKRRETEKTGKKNRGVGGASGELRGVTVLPAGGSRLPRPHQEVTVDCRFRTNVRRFGCVKQECKSLTHRHAPGSLPTSSFKYHLKIPLSWIICGYIPFFLFFPLSSW